MNCTSDTKLGSGPAALSALSHLHWIKATPGSRFPPRRSATCRSRISKSRDLQKVKATSCVRASGLLVL